MEISGFGVILLFVIGGIAFLMVSLLVSRLLRPSRPNNEKLTVYESGEDPVGDSRGQFNPRFYIIALVFLLFEVEIVFLFPWSVVFSDETLNEITANKWGAFVMIEMFVFIAILLIGLIYAWSNGFLEWIKPKVKKVKYDSPVPEDMYQKYM